MDEADNMLGALSVSQGNDIYKGFFSQHTPFVYYFMSIFAIIGVHDYEAFRLCMSFVIFGLWVFMYLRYSKYFNPFVFKIFVLLYALTINITWAHMILSDVFYGFSLLFLFLETLIFVRTNSLTIKSMVIISISVFVSVMSAFVSVYSIFALLFSLFIYEVFKRTIIKNIKVYMKLIGFMTVPFIILFLWYWGTDNLYNFYFQAYKLNRVHYSNYTGIGNSVIGLFKVTFTAWIDHITYYLTVLSKESLFSSLLVLFNLLFCYYHFKRDKALSIIIFIFLAFTGIRGYIGFHAIPYYMVTFFNCSFIISEYLRNKENNIMEGYKRSLLKICIFLLVICSLNSYLPNVGSNLTKPKGTMAAYYYDDYINKLTKKSDKIWISNLSPQTYINTNRMPALRTYILVPWFMDAFKNEIMEDIIITRPKLVIFEKESDVWGHKYSIFAKDILDYLNVEYKPLNENDNIERNIYIRNDFYKEANEILWPNSTGVENGMLVTNGINIYLIEDNTKRHITTPEVFERLGYDWSKVVEKDDESLKLVKTGAPIE
ncbi:hypothetical protein J2T13_003747 [Paenibacillus sp. DS2015]|uniref:hypothetical protein n=1 Tax=Paenibacillus sp. DS2015 TaxID=3373917 RepID=UPI003D2088E3